MNTTFDDLDIGEYFIHKIGKTLVFCRKMSNVRAFRLYENKHGHGHWTIEFVELLMHPREIIQKVNMRP